MTRSILCGHFDGGRSRSDLSTYRAHNIGRMRLFETETGTRNDLSLRNSRTILRPVSFCRDPLSQHSSSVMASLLRLLLAHPKIRTKPVQNPTIFANVNSLLLGYQVLTT